MMTMSDNDHVESLHRCMLDKSKISSTGDKGELGILEPHRCRSLAEAPLKGIVGVKRTWTVCCLRVENRDDAKTPNRRGEHLDGVAHTRSRGVRAIDSDKNVDPPRRGCSGSHETNRSCLISDHNSHQQDDERTHPHTQPGKQQEVVPSTPKPNTGQ